MTEFNRTEITASGLAPGGAVATCILREAEAWTSAQIELFSGMGAIWTDWLRRQRETIDAATRSLQRMFECRNPADIAQTQQQWLADAARRGASDISALACDSIALTWRFTGADRLGARGQSSPAPGTGRLKPGDDASPQRTAAA